MNNGKPISARGAFILMARISAIAATAGGVAWGQATQEGKITLDNVKQQIASFKDQLSKAKPAGSDAGERARSRQEVTQLFDTLSKVSDAIDESRYDDALGSLQDAPGIVTTDAYRQEVATLTDAVKKLAAADLDSIGGRAQALIKHVSEVIKTAKAPEDMAGVLTDLQTTTRRINEARSSPATRALATQWRPALTQATTTVSRYTELLRFENAGQFDAASSIASRLLNDNSIAETSSIREAIQQHMDASNKKQSETAQNDLDEIAKTLRDAKTSADLRPAQERLLSLSGKYARMGGGTKSQQIYGDIQQFQMWARVLDQESQNRYQTALNSLLQMRQQQTMDPRGNSGILTDDMISQKIAGLQKQILSRGSDFVDPTLKPMADAFTQAHTLDELEKGAAAVDASAASLQNAMDADAQPLMQELRETAGATEILTEMQKAIMAREWGRFWQLNQQSHNIYSGMGMMGNGEPHRNRWSAKIDTQRMKLMRDAVAESAEFKELKVTVQDDVPLDKTLLDAADTAIKAEDYRRAVLVMQTYVTFTYGSSSDYTGSAMGPVPEGIRADIQGLQLYAEGKSFETAGDLVSAVAAYRGVVRLTGERVPLTQAMERLSALGKSNPDLLKQPVAEPRVAPTDAH